MAGIPWGERGDAGQEPEQVDWLEAPDRAGERAAEGSLWPGRPASRGDRIADAETLSLVFGWAHEMDGEGDERRETEAGAGRHMAKVARRMAML